MKINKMILMTYVLSAVICTNGFAQKDAKKEAKKQNEEKFDARKMEKDAEFAVKAADDGMFEVQAAELAKTNASSPKVKDLATQMVKDHSKANVELKALAAKKNITLPAKLGNNLQKDFDELTKLKGVEFDREYTKQMVKKHKDAIDLFEKEADKGMDSDLKAWAAGKIAMLKNHLEMSESAHEAVKVMSTK